MVHFLPRTPRSGISQFLRLSIGCSLLLVWSVPVWSWGPLGHRVIARIAEQHLGVKARSRLRFYFGKDMQLADQATWADEVRAERPETAPWHYINIPPQATALRAKRDCPQDDCVTAKIREFVGIARLAMRDKGQVTDAARYVIHLAGDLHQPLHAGHAEDRGGNGIIVNFRGEDTNLHQVWDSGILSVIGEDEVALADRLSARITPRKKKEWLRGRPVEWAWESHLAAVQVAYGALPPGETKVLGDEYLRQARPLIEEQLSKAGVRLAELLNQTWP